MTNTILAIFGLSTPGMIGFGILGLIILILVILLFEFGKIWLRYM